MRSNAASARANASFRSRNSAVCVSGNDSNSYGKCKENVKLCFSTCVALNNCSSVVSNSSLASSRSLVAAANDCSTTMKSNHFQKDKKATEQTVPDVRNVSLAKSSFFSASTARVLALANSNLYSAICKDFSTLHIRLHRLRTSALGACAKTACTLVTTLLAAKRSLRAASTWLCAISCDFWRSANFSVH